MRPVTLMIVDDHPLALGALRAALDDEDDIVIVAEARSGDEALERAAREAPDVVLLDISMPGTSGLACIAPLKANGSTRVVVFSGADDSPTVRRALAAGADAFVSKQIDPRDLAASIRQVVEGTVISQPPAAAEERPSDSATLTARERDILRELASGARNRDIARTQSLSEHTVKYHLRRIYSKLGVPGRVEAVNVALATKLVEDDGTLRAPLN